MGILSKGRNRDEEPPGTDSTLELDLDLRACPVCHRDLHPWQPTCPDDGAAAVPRNALTTNFPPPPAHLLADDPQPDRVD